MKKFRKIAGISIVALVVIYLLGPQKTYDPISFEFKPSSLTLEELPAYVEKRNNSVSDLRPDNGAQLVFADSMRRTEYVLLYLHGWSASPVEGDPIHLDIAKRYGMNFYAPLLTDHGRFSKDSFLDVTPDDLIDDASEALAIAQLLGEKVIVMSVSTGGTLAAYLSAKMPEAITAQLLFAPNFDIEDKTVHIINNPWGFQIAKMINGGVYNSFVIPDAAMPHWTTTYRLEGVVALRTLIDETMTEDNWKAFKTPYLVAYYYEDEETKDMVVSTDAMARFHEISSTPEKDKWLRPLAEPKTHVITSGYQSENLEVVRKVTFDFLESQGVKVADEKPAVEM